MDAAKVWDEVDAAYKKWGQQDPRNYQVLEEEKAGTRAQSSSARIARELVRGMPLDADVAINETVETAMLTEYLDELKAVNLAQGAGGFGGFGGRGQRGGRGGPPPEGGRGGEGFGFPGRGGGPDIKELNLKAFLTGKTTAESAAAMVKASKLADPAFRATLNSKEAVAKSDDPLIRLALTLEPASAKIRKEYDDTIGSLEASAAEKIAAYRFRLFGAADYPDGTSTPRLAYGVVRRATRIAREPLLRSRLRSAAFTIAEITKGLIRLVNNGSTRKTNSTPSRNSTLFRPRISAGETTGVRLSIPLAN